MPDGRARQFTWVQDAKSVVTRPCAERPLVAKGPQIISGLAWSGRGKIQQVDVSLDGGKNWRTATFDAPVFDKCLTRFQIPWDWNGGDAMLQSRAIDDTGYVQPTFADLRGQRGTTSIYHNNAIHTWLIDASGEVENVQVS